MADFIYCFIFLFYDKLAGYMKFKYTCPNNDDKRIPFSKTFISKLVSYYNMLVIKKEKIIKLNKDVISLYNELNEQMKKYNLYDKYWLWARKIENMIIKKFGYQSKYQRIIQILRYYDNKEFMPEKPQGWYKQPNKWLSNYDIENVMQKFEECKRYKYKFLGVFPIDFSVMAQNGTCIYSHFCKLNIKELIQKKISYIGLITNLDKHDEPGSHWTSTFMVIDDTKPTYGIYYYDSVGNGIPKYLIGFIKSIQKQCNNINPNKKIQIYINKKQHQFKNTECGMFSMIFQIRWLNKHIVKKNKTSMKEIISNPFIDDIHMLKLRDELFRPNFSTIKL